MTSTGDPLTLAAVVLAGGRGVRLGGVDKASLELDGVSLLEHALAATMAAGEVVVVGEPRDTSRPVIWTIEEPAGGGPAAGLLAGVDALTTAPALVWVLAVDMPRVHASTMARLTWAGEADDTVDGAVLRDGSGRRQPLCAVYRLAAVQAARPADRAAEYGLPMHRLVSGLRLVEVPAVGPEGIDVDTWQALQDLGR